jgi:hypothetical protein
MIRVVWLCGAWLAAQPVAMPATLQPKTVEAFDQYIHVTEARLERQARGEGNFLWADESPARRDQVRRGEAVVAPWTGNGEVHVPGGLIHDWIGAVFIPRATLQQALALVQDYDNHRKVYQPEVIGSKTLSRQDNHFRVYLRLLKKKVLTVVLSTEHDVMYFPLDARRCHSRSHSTRIAEVINRGEPGERELPPGNDHGFLWRLYSYWRFEERDGGVYVECQAISLTRSVPTGLGWLIEPIIRQLPRESLANTLRATQAALK